MKVRLSIFCIYMETIGMTKNTFSRKKRVYLLFRFFVLAFQVCRVSLQDFLSQSPTGYQVQIRRLLLLKMHHCVPEKMQDTKKNTASLRSRH